MPGNNNTNSGKARKATGKSNPRSSKRSRYNNAASNPIMSAPITTTTTPKRRSLRLVTSRKPNVPRITAPRSAFQKRQDRLIKMVISAPGNPSIIASGSTVGSPVSSAVIPAPTIPTPVVLTSSTTRKTPSSTRKTKRPSSPRKQSNKMEVDKTPSPSPPPSPSLSPPDNIDNVNNLHMSSEFIPVPRPSIPIRPALPLTSIPTPLLPIQPQHVPVPTVAPPPQPVPSVVPQPQSTQPVPVASDFDQAAMVRLLRESQSLHASQPADSHTVFLESFNKGPLFNNTGVPNPLPTTAFDAPHIQARNTLPPTFTANTAPTIDTDPNSILRQLVGLLQPQASGTSSTRAQKADPLGQSVMKYASSCDSPGFIIQRSQISANKAYSASKNMAPEQRERVTRGSHSGVSMITQSFGDMKHSHLQNIHNLMNNECDSIIANIHNGQLSQDVLLSFLNNIRSLCRLDLATYKDRNAFGGMVADIVSFCNLYQVGYIWNNIHALLLSQPHLPLCDALVSSGFYHIIPQSIVAARVRASGMKKSTTFKTKTPCPNLKRWATCTNKSVAHRNKYNCKPVLVKPVVSAVVSGPPAASNDST